MIKEKNPGLFHNQMIVSPKSHNPRLINDLLLFASMKKAAAVSRSSLRI